MTSLSRKRALHDLTHQREKNNSSNFPSLFDIAIQTCISHLEIYGSFDGLPFHPFGQPLFEEFVKRASQWRLTTEQRQAGIILFSESYGEDFLGPEYTGIRCSLQDDIPHLGAFAECLVYLDLSGGCVAGNSPGLEDKDMAFLSGLSRLKVLNLAGLKIGDTGLSHLVRSVTFGSSGPTLLEYLNLAGTDVSHRGIARLWSLQQQQQHRPQKQLVFQHLLGVDLSGTAVLPSLAETLFQEQTLAPEKGGWTKLGRNVELFPSQTLQEQQSATYVNHPNSYFEQENGMNPMQKWVDRLNRTYKLTFGQKPDLGGEDGLGLSECLALSKLSQVHFLPLSEPLAPHQTEYNRRGEEMKRTFAEERENRRRSKKRTKYSRGQDDAGDTRTTMPAGRGRPFNTQQSSTTSLANSEKMIIGENGLNHMFNLNMYQKVLSYVRLTFGTRTRSVASNGKPSGHHEGLAFVRVRSVVERQLILLKTEDIEMEEPQSASQQQKRQAVASQGWSAGMGPNGVEVSTIARLKTRYRPPPMESDETDRYDQAPQDSFTDQSIKQEDVKYEPQDHLQDDVKIEEDQRRDVYKQEDTQDLRPAPKAKPFNPFFKVSTPPASRTSSWVFSTSTSPRKQEPIPYQQPQGPPVSNLPTRRRAGQDIGNNYRFQPFIKPATEQTSNAIFITQSSPLKEKQQQQEKGGRPASKPVTMIKTRADKKPLLTPRTTFSAMKSGIGGGGVGGGSSVMQQWAKQGQQPQVRPTPLPSSTPVTKSPSKRSADAGSQDKKPTYSATAATGTLPSGIREFQFNDTKRDTVNLDRWIRTGGPGVPGGKTDGCTIASQPVSAEKINPFRIMMAKTVKEPTKTIRFDPRDELFADGDEIIADS